MKYIRVAHFQEVFPQGSDYTTQRDRQLTKRVRKSYWFSHFPKCSSCVISRRPVSNCPCEAQPILWSQQLFKY